MQQSPFNAVLRPLILSRSQPRLLQAVKPYDWAAPVLCNRAISDCKSCIND